MIGSLLILWKLSDARSSIVRVGVVLHAIRQDEIAARAVGINTVKYKVLAFSVSGFFAGIAGSFYAHHMGIAGPSTLELLLSIQAVIWTIFGGIGTIYGAVAGVYILYPLVEFLHVVSEIRMLAFGCIAVVVILFMPEGIAVWIRDKIERECPRCKLNNAAWRRTCRACTTELGL